MVKIYVRTEIDPYHSMGTKQTGDTAFTSSVQKL